MIFFWSSRALSRESLPTWMSWELKALIFSSSSFFCSRSLKNSWDFCWRASMTLFLSSSILFFSSSSWMSLDLSMMTLFFCSSSDRSRFSSFSYFLIRAFWSRSSFMSGLFFMLLARCANFRVERD